MINTSFDNLSGRAKSVRCFRQTEFLHSVCALNSYNATRTSRAIIDLCIYYVYIYNMDVYIIYMRIICLLDIVQKNSLCLLPQYTATMNECQILSVLKHRKGISQETWCQLPRLKWHFSNTVLIDVLTFTSSATGNSIHQKNNQKHESSGAPPPARLLHPSAAVQRLIQNLLMDPGAQKEHRTPRPDLRSDRSCGLFFHSYSCAEQVPLGHGKVITSLIKQLTKLTTPPENTAKSLYK